MSLYARLPRPIALVDPTVLDVWLVRTGQRMNSTAEPAGGNIVVVLSGNGEEYMMTFIPGDDLRPIFRQASTRA